MQSSPHAEAFIHTAMHVCFHDKQRQSDWPLSAYFHKELKTDMSHYVVVLDSISGQDRQQQVCSSMAMLRN
jgi:hypothetical protein